MNFYLLICCINISIFFFSFLQTATFVCSLCSLVLLTKNLLVEHLSQIHLEELDALAQGETHVEIPSKDQDTKDICSLQKSEQSTSQSLLKKEIDTNHDMCKYIRMLAWIVASVNSARFWFVHTESKPNDLKVFLYNIFI